MSSSNNKEKFEEIVKEFSLFKLDYNIEEMQRIKERAKEVFGIVLLVISIVMAAISQDHTIDKFAQNYVLVIIEMLGFASLIAIMTSCYRVMTARVYNQIIDPKILYDLYKNEKLEETLEIIRDTLFGMMKEMDERNNRFHYTLQRIYILTAIGLPTIFIPITAIILIK
jgi:hypothetical protein